MENSARDLKEGEKCRHSGRRLLDTFLRRSPGRGDQKLLPTFEEVAQLQITWCSVKFSLAAVIREASKRSIYMGRAKVGLQLFDGKIIE